MLPYVDDVLLPILKYDFALFFLSFLRYIGDALALI